MPSAARLWTPEEDAVLRRMREAGMDWTSCATALGRTASACVSRLHELTPGRAACSRRGRAWTPEEDEVLVRLAKQGLPWAEISRRIGGRSAKSCSSRASTLGLAKRRAAKPSEASPEASMRKCHDCGKATPDYRCPKCLAKWRARHGVAVYGPREDDDGAYTAFGARWAID